jgi:hypothetical protein
MSIMESHSPDELDPIEDSQDDELASAGMHVVGEDVDDEDDEAVVPALEDDDEDAVPVIVLEDDEDLETVEVPKDGLAELDELEKELQSETIAFDDYDDEEE